jgi:hypothetical protein
VTRGSDLGGSGRKGLTGAGGATMAQTKRRGATVVAQRSSRGHRQGGRGSSRRRCRAWGGDGWFGEGPEQRSIVAPRCQAQWCSCSEVAEVEERGCSTGRGAPFIAVRSSWQWRSELRPGAVEALKLWAQQSGVSRGPKAVGLGRASLFGQGD